MWIEKRKDKYLAVERFRDPMTGKIRRVSCVIDRDTQQSRNKARAILQAKMDVQEEPKNRAVTLSELKSTYIEYQKKIFKTSTVARNDNILKIVINIIGSDALCDRLTAGNVMKALLDTGKPNVTLNTYLTRLKAMLRWGYKNDLCPDIAGKLSLLPDMSERQKIADKFLETKDLKKLIDGMDVEKWQNLTRLMVLSGLRIGEALALTYSDLDTKNRLIHVTKTLDRRTKTTTSPKTTDSFRDVFMQNELLKLCRKLRTGSRRMKLECGYDSDLIFCDLEGKHISYDVYEKYLRENSERILNRRITSHYLRHTMTSQFAASGVPLDTIARRLGHHDSKLTRDIYLHCTQAQTKKDYDAVRNVSLLG